MITNPKDAFLVPKNPTHKKYEARRAFFVEGRKAAEIAPTFGYKVNTFRVMCSKFRKNPDEDFFIERKPGRKPVIPQDEDLRAVIIRLRKQNLSVYDIEDRLRADGRSLNASTIGRMLKEEGFAKLPRRRDDERPHKDRPETAATADVRNLDLSDRSFSTKYGGLFLLLPLLAEIPFDSVIEQAEFPGSVMIPAAHAVRSILALKLFGNARHTHVMSDVFDPGLALFGGLNVIPKTSFLSQYSCRVEPHMHAALLRLWFDAIQDVGYRHGNSFDLDFHSIPSHDHRKQHCRCRRLLPYGRAVFNRAPEGRLRLLMKAGVHQQKTRIPWLGNKKPHIQLG